MLANGAPLPVGLPAAGTLVGGKYRVERYIAEGGMGVIAVARHLELDEPVAIKFLKPDIVATDESGTVADRFVREARATIKIRSEHVPRIFDVTKLETGVPFIVMELLSGEDLDQRLERQGPLPILFVVDVILQALEALGAAHVLGMVHRDFKPANVFIGTGLDGGLSVKVLDFGIAKLVEPNGPTGDQGLTGTNAVMGSPRYMAPEQMRSARDVDARADVWAVGTTLYELITGTVAFYGASLTQVCAAILQDEPHPMAQHRPDVPPELEAVVRRCLAKRPSDRFASVAELASALAPFGTAPLSYDLAARIARVLGAAVPPGSSPSLHASSLSLSLSPSQPALAVAAKPSSSGIGMTNTSWSGIGPSPQARRRTWTIGAIFAGLFLVGAGLAGVALLRPRPPVTTGMVATNAPSASTGAASPIPPPTESTPPSPPASAPPEVAGTVAAPSSAATVPLAATTPKKAAAQPPFVPSAKASGPSPATPNASSNQGLWDDRK